MSDILTKDSSKILVSAGSPPVAAIPPSPSYCLTTVDKILIPYVPVPIIDEYGNVTIFYATYGDIKIIYKTTCYAGDNGSPGAPGKLAEVSTYYNQGWTGGARSIGTLTGDGRLEFSVSGSTVGVVVGFSTVDENASYYEINHGFYVSNSDYTAIENGTKLGISNAGNADCVYTIQRIGTQITYSVYDPHTNTYTTGTSSTPSTGTIFVNSSMYMAGDSIVDPLLTTAIYTPIANTDADVVGILAGLKGHAREFDGADVQSELAGLVGEAISYNTGRVAATLTRLVGEINCYAYPGQRYSSTSGILATGIVTSSSAESGGLKPQYCIAAGVMQPVTGFSIAIGGQAADVAGVLSGVTGYAANVESAQCMAQLTPLTGKIRQGIPGNEIGWLYTNTPKPKLFAVGTADFGVRLGANLKVPKPTLLAYGAGQARLKAPKVTIKASGTVTSVGRAELVMPKPVLTISATVTRSGALAATIRPKWQIAAYAGGTARVRGPRFALLASAKVGALGRARLTAPWPTLRATGKVGDVVRVAGVLGGMVMPGMGVFIRNVPKAYLRSIAVTAATVAYEGYSITLLTDEQGNPAPAVTHYTNFPFDRIVRWGGKYYGVAQDGLYELGGDTFNGSPIIAEVETAESDLGSPQLKHPRHLYMGGRMGADLTVKIKSSETDTNTYEYTPAATGARTRRVQFGRGIRARYFSFGFKNKDGDDFYVDELTPEVDVARRRV